MIKHEVLAIIPARGGSKGIPRKNIRLFAGKPLISYSIMDAIESTIVTRIIVSTDDIEIANVAREWGAGVPFIRPAELATDQALDLPVFQHALRWLDEHEGYHPEIVVHLRPTTPIRPPDIIDSAVNILLDNPEADSVRALTPAQQNPYKMWLVDSTEPIRPLLTVHGINESYNAPRQILPRAYAHTGLLDVIRPNTILNLNSMSGNIILPIFFEQKYSFDLDTLDDWERAEQRLLSGLDMK
jgi:N-acylneuraminate cytidylyltransferase